MGKRRRSEPLTGCCRGNGQGWENEGAMASVLAEDHMLWLILQHLPLLNLFQCKSVCKVWNSVISDPTFHRQYLSTCPRSKSLNAPELEVYLQSRLHRCKSHQREQECTILRFGIVGEQQEEPEKDDLLSSICRRSPNVCFPDNIWLVQSSCGVVLLFDFGHSQFLVYSPLSRAMIELSPSPPAVTNFKFVFICREPHGCGSNYDFEVVMIPAPDHAGLDQDNSMMISTYSSNTSQWSRAPVPGRLLRRLTILEDGLAVVRGKVYWSTRHQDVAVYDPATGQVEALPLPPAFKSRKRKYPVLGQDATEALLCCIFYHDRMDVFKLCNTTASATHDIQTSAHQLWTRTHGLEFAQLTRWMGSSESISNEEVWEKLCVNRVGFDGPNYLVMSFINDKAYNLESGEFEPIQFDVSSFDVPFHIPSWPYALQPDRLRTHHQQE